MSRNLLGTYTQAGSVSDQFVQSATLGSGSTLVAAFTFNNGGSGGPDDITWNGVTFPTIASSDVGVGGFRVCVFPNADSGTHDFIADFTSAGDTGNIAVELFEYTGVDAASLDQITAVATATSTSPASASTATTTQADEYVAGFVGTFGPSSDSAGSWGAGMSTGSRVGIGASTAGATIADGYRTVSSTGTYQTSVTGITSRRWFAVCLTLKETVSPPLSLTIGPCAAGTDAPAPTLTASMSIGPASAEATAGAPSLWIDGRFPYAVAPPSAVSPLAVSRAASVGMRSFGQPYFAAWQNVPFEGFGGGEQEVKLLVALSAPPEKALSDTEPHWLFSLHEVGGQELVALGVTPDLRAVGYTSKRGTILSAPAAVRADGSFFVLSLFMADQTRKLSVGDTVLAFDTHPGELADGMYSEAGLPCRVMVFNGAEARTRCAATLMSVVVYTENNNVVWPFNDGGGGTAGGLETHSGMGDPIDAATDLDFPDADWTLTCGWYDPRPTFALPFGAPSSSSLSAAFRWLIQTQYRRGTIVRPAYRASGASGGTYHEEGVVEPT